jgi:hypothetical protein
MLFIIFSETLSYHSQEIYVGVTYVRAKPLKHPMFMTERRAQNISELTEMLIIPMRQDLQRSVCSRT